MGKKIAVILTGAGHIHGTEITEAVSLIVNLSELGAKISYFAPETSRDGNLIPTEEAQKITRTPVKKLSELNTNDFDALAMPGGYGVAKHLCSWATDGSNCWVNPHAEKIIKSFHAQSKPIAAICIAPALVAKVLGQLGVTVTIGNDTETAQEIEKTGAHHETCPVDDFITDRDNKVITCPAYMYADAPPHKVFTGIQKLAKELCEMA